MGRSKGHARYFCAGRYFFSAVFTFPAVFFFVKNRGTCRFFVFFFAVRFNGFCVKKCFSRVYFYVHFLFSKRTQTLAILAYRIKSIGRCTIRKGPLHQKNKSGKEIQLQKNNARTRKGLQKYTEKGLLQYFCSNSVVIKHSFYFNQRRRYAVALFRNHRFI